MPQSFRVPRAAASALRTLERADPVAAAVLRLRGQWLYAVRSPS
jgi:hypothetical protein